MPYNTINCNTLQPTTTHCNICATSCRLLKCAKAPYFCRDHFAPPTHGNTLEHTGTYLRHCNVCATYVQHLVGSLQFHVSFANRALDTLQHTATHCNTLQHTVTHCNTLQHTATHWNTLQHIATHYNTLQRMCNVSISGLFFLKKSTAKTGLFLQRKL